MHPGKMHHDKLVGVGKGMLLFLRGGKGAGGRALLAPGWSSVPRQVTQFRRTTQRSWHSQSQANSQKAMDPGRTAQQICPWAQGECTPFWRQTSESDTKTKYQPPVQTEQPLLSLPSPWRSVRPEQPGAVVHQPTKWQDRLWLCISPAGSTQNSSTFCELLTLPGRLLFGLSVQPQAMNQCST